jgi:hypothetical protein
MALSELGTLCYSDSTTQRKDHQTSPALATLYLHCNLLLSATLLMSPLAVLAV